LAQSASFGPRRYPHSHRATLCMLIGYLTSVAALPDNVHSKLVAASQPLQRRAAAS